MQQRPRKFRARKDVLGGALVVVIFAIGAVLVSNPGLMPLPLADKLAWLFVLLGVLAWWDWMITSYEFLQEDLVIRGALSEKRIALCNVEEVHARGKGLRLKCHCLRGSSWLTIMPVNRSGFMARLREKCPWIVAAHSAD